MVAIVLIVSNCLNLMLFLLSAVQEKNRKVHMLHNSKVCR